jgi:hypothetical protein
LANLVAVKETSYDTIDDLLNPKVYIWMWGDLEFLREENKLVDDSQLREKLEKLFDKIGKRTSASEMLKLLSNPDEAKKIGKNFVVVGDQYFLRNIEVSKFCSE